MAFVVATYIPLVSIVMYGVRDLVMYQLLASVCLCHPARLLQRVLTQWQK